MKPDPLRLHLAGVSTPMMQGDNLSIVLASAFGNPDQEVDGDTGWTQDAINGALEVLDAIHAHYARALLEAHQRGRREGMEEAANIASGLAGDFCNVPVSVSADYHMGQSDGADASANSIRAKMEEQP